MEVCQGVKGSTNGQYRMGSQMVIGKQGVHWVSKGQLTRHAYLVLTENVFLIFRLNLPCDVKLNSTWVCQ